MEAKNRLWWGTAVLSVSALMLTACGDDGDEDDVDTDDVTTEETDEATEDEGSEEDADDAGDLEDEDGDVDDENGDTAETALDEDEIRDLLLTEEEFPVDVEEFVGEESVSGGEALTIPDTDDVETCDDLAEMMQDPQTAEDYMGSGEEVEIAGLFSMGMWNVESPDSSEVNMLQTGVMSYGEDFADYQDDYDLIRECEGETFTMEEDGIQMDMSFEYLEYGDWEGMTMLMSTSMGEESFDMDIDILTYEDDTNALFVSGMGEGRDYIEEFADLQLEKYGAGL